MYKFIQNSRDWKTGQRRGVRKANIQRCLLGALIHRQLLYTPRSIVIGLLVKRVFCCCSFFLCAKIWILLMDYYM